MISVRVHNKKKGDVTILRVKKGTSMKKVMRAYAESRGVSEDRLVGWKRRRRQELTASNGDDDPPLLPKKHEECTDCGCTGYYLH